MLHIGQHKGHQAQLAVFNHLDAKYTIVITTGVSIVMLQEDNYIKITSNWMAW